MSNISFDEDSQYVRADLARTSNKNLVEFIKSRGWAKDDAQAEKILLAIAGAAILIAVGAWWFSQPHTREGQYRLGEPISAPSQKFR